MIAFLGSGPAAKFIGLKLSDAKKLFFDADGIAKRFNRAEGRVFPQFGRYVMRTAKRSIKNAGKKARSAVAGILLILASPGARYNRAFREHWEDQLDEARRKLSSRPGRPPHNIQGGLKNNIFFCADLSRRSVVIGPTLINKPTGAPRTLEEGGFAVIVSRRGGHQVQRRVKVAPRPYMKPAFDKSLPALPRMWRDSVR